MAPFRVGIIGCGRPWRSAGSTGFGMAHEHALGYRTTPDATIVALADLSLENARAFQEQHGGEKIYQDYHEMLAAERPDIVSICTWPHLHAEMVIAAAEAGVRAIHCEKPMAPTYGEARRMLAACEASGAQLTFNHQRRFGEPFRRARELLEEGAVGRLVRLEASCGDMFDWGTHWFDMLLFYHRQQPVEWVIGQVDTRGGNTVFGVPLEGHGLSHFRFADGVEGLLTTGVGAGGVLINRIIGEEGTIEVGHSGDVPLRVRGRGDAAWRAVPVSEGLHPSAANQRAVHDLVDALRAGREPELSGRRALQATELIFATYESSRRRGRVDLPLDIDDSPLAAIQAGG